MLMASSSTTTSRSSIDSAIPAELHIWIDLNLDGDWDDAQEKVIDRLPVEIGQNEIDIDLPGEALPGPSYLRVRLVPPRTELDPPLKPIDDLDDPILLGEVEDYPVTLFFQIFNGNFE